MMGFSLSLSTSLATREEKLLEPGIVVVVVLP